MTLRTIWPETIAKPVAAGKRGLSVRFIQTGKNLKPDFFSGDAVLAVDGEKVGEPNRIEERAEGHLKATPALNSNQHRTETPQHRP